MRECRVFMAMARSVPDRLTGLFLKAGFRQSHKTPDSWYVFVHLDKPVSSAHWAKIAKPLLDERKIAYEWRPMRRRKPGRTVHRPTPLPVPLTARPKSR